MILLIDLGNSRLKWARAAPNAWETGAVTYPGRRLEDMLDAVWRGMEQPERIVMCSVAAPALLDALKRWLGRSWSLAPVVIHSRTEQLGVKNGYQEPGTLGADRWAALIAARGLTQAPACIVDCGTAVTVDALSGSGEFLGGAIFPGLGLLRESLVRGTDGIRATEGNENSCPARSTADGVAAGTLLGLCGAVERLIAEYRRVLGPDTRVLLTGGDAPRLGPCLTHRVTEVPDLVLKGLARIAAIP